MLTVRQKEALVFIASEIQRTGGVAPSVDELRISMRLSSPAQAARYMQQLAERGYIRRIPGRWRAIEVVDRDRPEQVPIVRVVPCRWFRFDDTLKSLVTA